MVHVLNTQVALVLQGHDAQQVVRGDSAESQTQRLYCVQRIRVARLLVHEVIDRRIELHYVVAVERLVHVLELQVRVLLTETQVYDFFVLQERKLFQGFFEVLHFTEDLGKALAVVDVELWVKSVVGFEGF